MYNLQYLLLTFIAVWVFWYAGNCLKVESDRVMHAISNCPWHLCGGPFRRDVLMLMLSTSKPLTLTGGNFFIMDYDKFRAVCFYNSVCNMRTHIFHCIFSDNSSIIFVLYSFAEPWINTTTSSMALQFSNLFQIFNQ